MKKFFATTILFFVTSLSYAQFSNYDDVYCYEFDYNDNEGVLSKGSGNKEHIWVYFNGTYMGYYSTYQSKSSIQSNILSDERYYEKLAKKNYDTTYSKWANSSGTISCSPYPYYQPLPTPYANIYAYYSNDPYGYYTYRYQGKSLNYSGNQGGTTYHTWSSPDWKNDCWSFTIDKKVMYKWKNNKSQNRTYYKLIDPASFKPNIDFLY